MRPRRLALVVGQLQRGGAERQLFELAVRLDRGRFDPLVVCLSEVVDPWAGRLRERGVEVVALARSGHRDPARVVALASILRSRRVALAHSFLIAANAYTWAATRIAGRQPYVASSRTCITPVGRAPLWVHRRAFRGAAAVVANARAVADFTASLYGVVPGRIEVIPNGLDPAPFEEAARRRPALRAAERVRYGIAPDDPMVCWVGRLSPEKNPLLLVEAAAEIRRRSGMPIRFVVAGDGPSRRSLEEAIGAAGLASSFHLAGARDDVPALLTAADLFVQTSDTEGLPNAVMEAMAAGLPVVATRVGGTMELIEEGETGFGVPAGDPGALAGAILTLGADPEARLRLGARGRDRILASFTVETMVERTVALYERIPA